MRQFPDRSTIAVGGYFIWANSAGGFSETIGADTSSTATLAAANSIALMNASGTIVDAVAWGAGVSQYIEGSAYPTDPISNQLLTRKFLNGIIVDTENNADDFTI